jgi:PIN domain nuclease of toxin-antitoxin system
VGIAKLFEKGRIDFSIPLGSWFSQALERPETIVIPMSPNIIIESINLPGEFHKDPADQIIVATARILDCTMVTADEKILSYPHVNLYI